MFLKTSGIIHIHFISWKLVLNCVSIENFKFSKKKLWIFMFSIDWTFFSTNQKMWIFRPKLIANSIPIRLLLDQSNFVSLNLRSLLDCSRLIEIRIFWIRKAFDKSVYPILFHSLQFLSFLENFLLSLLESKLQGFLRCHLVRLFYHFLSIIFNLHMHNHQIFQNFWS